ncbi:terminase [Occallatibacter riparius]|uniref:Terminase n=1 Tax=Occallatibacter riparius TaxID=1002689 RepID=A0A9J7BY23_9BACT|nr:terminase [Occallatibacter riparius]UWZ86046.1 terminase [Occallatibacter riparius]
MQVNAEMPGSPFESGEFEPEELDRDELVRLGPVLDYRPASLGGKSVLMEMAERLLCVRTRDGEISPLRANLVQRMFERKRGAKNIVLKARQMGLTTWTAARFFLKTITRPGTLTLQVAHTQEAAEEIFRIVHRFYDWLPEELREGPLRTSRANARQIALPELDSQYRVVTAGDRNAGRGLTVQNLHCSELARWPGDPADILAGLRAALAPGAEEILESTPQGVGGCFYDEWQHANETGTVRHFFPWWMERHYCKPVVAPLSLTEEEAELRARAHLDFEQIAYRRSIRANLRGMARQEYAEDAESCFLASGESVFELSAVDARLASAPVAAESRRNGELEIWLPPVKGRQYLVAVDPAGGGSEGDYSAAQVVDVATGMQCAEFASHTGGLELAKFITGLAREYNGAVLVMERNNHGTGIVSLCENVCGYRRIFRQNGQAGWLTTSISRPAMLGRLNAALVENPDLFMSRKLLGELRSFVRQPDGSTGAASGTHDDRVMAMAIALAARAEVAERQGQRDQGTK